MMIMIPNMAAAAAAAVAEEVFLTLTCKEMAVATISVNGDRRQGGPCLLKTISDSFFPQPLEAEQHTSHRPRGGRGGASRAPSPVPSYMNDSIVSDGGRSRSSVASSNGRASLSPFPSPIPPRPPPPPVQPQRQWLQPTAFPPPLTATLIDGGGGVALPPPPLMPVPAAAAAAATASVGTPSVDTAVMDTHTPPPPLPLQPRAVVEMPTALAEATTAAAHTLAALDRAMQTDSPVATPRRRRQQQQQQQPDIPLQNDIAEARAAASQTLNALTEANVNAHATAAAVASTMNPYRRPFSRVMPSANVRLQAIQQPAAVARSILRPAVLHVGDDDMLGVEQQQQQQQIIPAVHLPLGVPPQPTVQLLQPPVLAPREIPAVHGPFVLPAVHVTPPSPPPPQPLPPAIATATAATRPILRPPVLGNVIPAVRLPMGVAGPSIRLQAIQEQEQPEQPSPSLLLFLSQLRLCQHTDRLLLQGCSQQTQSTHYKDSGAAT